MIILVPKHRHFIDGSTIYNDTETTGRLPYRGDRPFAFSFMNDAGDERYFEFEVDPLTRRVIPQKGPLKQMAALLGDPAIRKVGFNYGFDMHMMDQGYGIKTVGCTWDVMWMSHIADSAAFKHALKPLSDKFGLSDADDEKELGAAVQSCRLAVGRKLGWKIAREETDAEDRQAYKADYWLPAAVVRCAPKDVQEKLLARWPNLAVLNKVYAIKDAFRTGGLCHLYTRILDDENLWEVFNRELKMFPVTYRAEDVGVRIFQDRCTQLGRECGEVIERLRAQLTKIFGTFEKDVPDARIRKYLFGFKGAPVQFEGGEPQQSKGIVATVLTGKTKQASVAKEVVSALSLQVPEVQIILDHKKYKKVWTHYIQKYLSHACQDAANQLIIHANFRQIGPVTGRMACADPPLQQTPKRAVKGDIMKRVRWPFGPRKNCVWLHFDYKSIEPRILAEEAEEPDIIRIFNEGQACAAVEGGWTHDPYEVLVDGVAEATGKDRVYLDALFESRGGARQVCKNNFLGWTYGEGTFKLASQLGCSLDEAFTIINALKTVFPGVMPFMQYMQDIAKEYGFILNRYGRKCTIPPPSRVFDEEVMCWKWIDWWYKATNYKIQGTAADMLKEAAIRLGADPERFIWEPKQQGVYRLSQKAGYLRGSGCEIVMFVHDELIVEAPAKLAIQNEKFVRGIGEVMADNQGMFKRVATPVDAKVTWGAWSDPEELESLWN